MHLLNIVMMHQLREWSGFGLQQRLHGVNIMEVLSAP